MTLFVISLMILDHKVTHSEAVVWELLKFDGSVISFSIKIGKRPGIPHSLFIRKQEKAIFQRITICAVRYVVLAYR